MNTINKLREMKIKLLYYIYSNKKEQKIINTLMTRIDHQIKAEMEQKIIVNKKTGWIHLPKDYNEINII